MRCTMRMASFMRVKGTFITISAVREKSLLLTPVTVNVTWRLLLKLVPRLPAETFMVEEAKGEWMESISSPE
jgi:hypothetical protein